jgi:formylglycine-generating enzyme required for sulfatase activity
VNRPEIPRARDDQEPTIIPAAFKPSADRHRRKRSFRLLPGILLIGLLVLGLVGWFMFAAKSVQFLFQPAPENVAVQGDWPVLRLGGRYLLLPGKYSVAAETPGYYPLTRSVELTAAQNQTYRFDLKKLPGRLSVVSIPAGAKVMIDGQGHGATPLAAVKLRPGKHSITVMADRYLNYQSDVRIDGGGAEQELTVKLTPAWALVKIGSIPAGAEVLIDGRTVGKTPLTTEVLQGAHDLQISLPGYKTWQGDFTVIANEPQTLPNVTLEQADGRVMIGSDPTGANVVVNGVYRGQTPLELALAPDQTHEIVLSKAGYESASRTLELRAEETARLSVALEARLGEVRIVAHPADAQVYVDGELRGEANQVLSLTAVPHEFEIRKAGYAAHRATVTPRPGFAQELNVELKTLAQAEAAATPAVIKTAAGQELRRLPPGQFTMGASRSEQGRRANESLRKVRLTRAFYLSTREVTNEEFREFAPEHSSGIVQQTTLDLDDQPVARITWAQAALYCNWLSEKEGLPPVYEIKNGEVVATDPLSMGYRLPTEAEWTWAARFASGDALKYPWGDAMPPSPKAGNYADTAANSLVPYTLAPYRDGYPASAPVASFRPNELGFYDLGGNVAEWVHDHYEVYLDSLDKAAVDPIGPSEGAFHVIRGSSWMHASITELRLSFRDYGDEPRPDLGFRIARYAE